MTTDQPAGDVTPGAEPPDDPEQIRQEIERTRDQLGETVEALVAKADVKAQAKERVGQLSDRLKDKTAQVKDTAAQAKDQATARVGQARSQLAGKTSDAKTAAVQTGGPARDQIQARAAAVGGAVRDATPEPVQRAARHAAEVTSQRRGLVAGAVVGIVVVLGFIVFIRGRRQ
jgi:chromosome segregation ATPase